MEETIDIQYENSPLIDDLPHNDDAITLFDKAKE